MRLTNLPKKPLRKMTPNEKKLVAALESGKYKQTYGKLKDRYGYCCLGVACEISGLGNFSEEDIFKSGLQQDAYELIPKVRQWLGWKNVVGSTRKKFDQEECLAELNDKGCTFKQIAKVIRLGLVETL